MDSKKTGKRQEKIFNDEDLKKIEEIIKSLEKANKKSRELSLTRIIG